ncbi:hypothetical protein C0J52_05496 [Blattella germanica]|nr:hypothetical protein C0J52_05496 [Blattella germanica]
MGNCAWIAAAHLNIKCPVCSRDFVNRSNLNIHIRDVHSEERGPFSCPWCGKQVKNRSCLRVHMYQQHRKKDLSQKTDDSPGVRDTAAALKRGFVSVCSYAEYTVAPFATDRPKIETVFVNICTFSQQMSKKTARCFSRSSLNKEFRLLIVND